MKLTNEVYIVGSGYYGIGITNKVDCYVYLIDGGDGNLALVDAGVGVEPERIVANIEMHGFNPKDVQYLLLTHAHTDHVGGTRYFRDLCECKVVLSEGEADLVETANEVGLGLNVAKKSGFYPMDFTVSPCPVDMRVNDDDEIQVGNLNLKVLVTPGHSRAHTSYVMQGQEKRYIFVGDHITWGGLMSLQNYPNSGSSIDGYRETAHKFEGLNIDAFLPGHMLFGLSDGQIQLDRLVIAANDLFGKGSFYLPPPAF